MSRRRKKRRALCACEKKGWRLDALSEKGGGGILEEKGKEKGKEINVEKN